MLGTVQRGWSCKCLGWIMCADVNLCLGLDKTILYLLTMQCAAVIHPFLLSSQHFFISMCWGVCALVLAPSACCLVKPGQQYHPGCFCSTPTGDWGSPGGFLSIGRWPVIGMVVLDASKVAHATILLCIVIFGLLWKHQTNLVHI